MSSTPTTDQRRIALVRDWLAKDPKAQHLQISAGTGIPESSVRRIRKLLEQPTGVLLDRAVSDPVPKDTGAFVSGDEHSLVTKNPASLDDLLDACRVDRSRWRVARWVANKWEVGTKQEGGKVLRTPLYQIKAWLEPIPGLEDSKVIRDTIAWVRTQKFNTPPAPKAKLLPADDSILLELSIPDAHLGKLAWAEETGENYDSAIAETVFFKAVENLAEKSAIWPVDKVLFVVGNDFFNVDNAAGTTTAGTPQSEDGRWPRTFRRGIGLLTKSIDFLAARFPQIEVRVIRGNHDSERMFYAGEVLAAVYNRPGSRVEVVNQPIKRQYIRWGEVLLGLAHGDGLKHDKLPLLMAGEAPDLWAKTTHREWHVGHLHHKKETQYHTGTEHNAVRVRILPSLTTADDWHYTNGYVGAQRAAEAYLWGKKQRYIGHLSWSPPRD
jgi:hypothetical protein